MNGSVRTRITLLYGGFFTVITVAVLLLALGFQGWVTAVALGRGGDECRGTECDAPPVQDIQEGVRQGQRLVILAAIAVIAVLGFAVCWWLTGRLLRPLHRITATARRLSLSTLHERIALGGPDDELRRLADTFDAMLDRLERAVDSQRRFIANASHELRTPLAVQRTAIEVGLADPSPERLAVIRAELLRNTLRSERLIAGLLLLAKGERGPDVRTSVDLSAVVTEVVTQNRDGVTVTVESPGPVVVPAVSPGPVAVTVDSPGPVAVTVDSPGPVVVPGDEVMLAQLVANLVQNAVRYNVPGGTVTVSLTRPGRLTVTNTGPVVPADRAAELFEPFRRLDADRTAGSSSAGLGLSIVAAIARSHGGTATLTPNPDGGLTVRVDLPAHMPAFSSHAS
ncbi:HAMP domain-containing sensor histidine kinase [Actinoplanes sp. NPDC026670]|uniref:sensor histidine kinase n=1 Tax=Actinoplanes sp. NPDC026670 TaxID=3154700 RepID=UPI0034013C9E